MSAMTASHIRLERCGELASPNIPNFVVSILLLVGMVISYLPQHIRIIQRRSAGGISPYFVLLGTISATCAASNILTLPTSRHDIGCCRVIGPVACAAGLLGIAQMVVQWACFFVITMLFLLFVIRPGPSAERRKDPSTSSTSIREAVTVVTICVVHILATLLVSIILLARFPNSLGLWANILGLAGTIIACIQYFPQIWTTYKLKHVGSLSIPMMILQTPGAFILAASLAARLGSAGWSSWIVYVVTGLLQGVLLVLALTYYHREKKHEHDRQASWTSSDPEDEAGGLPDETHEYDDEETPLLHDRQREETQRRLENRHDHPLAPHRLNPGPNSTPEGTPEARGSAPIAVIDGDDHGRDGETTNGQVDRRTSVQRRWDKGDFSTRVW